MSDIHQSFAQQGLVRPGEGRVLGGVCARLGRRFGIAPWPARILFVLLLMVIPGSQILIYPIMWIHVPSDETVRVESLQTPPTLLTPPPLLPRSISTISTLSVGQPSRQLRLAPSLDGGRAPCGPPRPLSGPSSVASQELPGGEMTQRGRERQPPSVG
jgi:phage shock protein C